MSDRKHLVSTAVQKLLDATKGTRHETRDRCLLLLMFRHGLRVSEACGLRLSQVDIESRVLHVKRLKDGLSTTHPLRGDELRTIKAWLTERAQMKPKTDAFFISERRSPLSRKTAWVMIRDYGRTAGLSVEAHPQMLRHACGFALADQGADTRLIQDYLGHRNIQYTVRYTATNPARFDGCGGNHKLLSAGRDSLELQIKDLLEWFRTNPAILTTLVTALAALVSSFAALKSASASRTSARVAQSQRELAERQYALQRRHQELEERRAKQELYERRLAVYQAVKALLDVFEVRAGVSKEEANTFFRSRTEADFLFQGDEIPEYLKKMSINAQFLASYLEQLNDTYALPVGEQRNEYVNKVKELQIWFSEQGKTAKEKFKPYLDISTATTSLATTLQP